MNKRKTQKKIEWVGTSNKIIDSRDVTYDKRLQGDKSVVMLKLLLQDSDNHTKHELTYFAPNPMPLCCGELREGRILELEVEPKGFVLPKKFLACGSLNTNVIGIEG